jgi:hypothetical protein
MDIAKCICINITNFDFTKKETGYSRHVIKDYETNETLEGLNDLDIYFVELPKREKVGDTRLQKWMALFSSTSWEEMKRNAEGDEIMEQVYEQAREIALNESKRIEVERRELFLIGQNSLERYGRDQERIEIAKNLLDILDVETIAERTKLTVTKVIELKKNI